MSAAARAKNVGFETLERLDEWLHSRGFTWARLCLLVGRLEPAYYERNIDWENPIYVKPPAALSSEDATRPTGDKA